MTDSRSAVSVRNYPRPHLVLAAVLSTCLVLALTLLPSPDATATRTVRLQPPLATSETPAQAALEVTTNTETALTEETAEESQEPVLAWSTAEVKKGDTLSHIFKRVGLGPREVQDVVSAKGDLSELKKIHPGQKFRFGMKDGVLESLEYIVSRTETLKINHADDGYVASFIKQELVPFTSYAEGTITSSLFLAAQKSGLSNAMTMELANIFGWDVDFALDIREGDSFRVIYQELYLNGEKVKDGQILAAEFTNQGKTFTAIRYDSPNGNSNYYTPEGDSMRKAFLRSPIDFARISSHFNLSRKHPVLHTIRAHKGTDYAASRGTPIKATGDGKIVYAGRKGGYGNAVIIQHGQTYKTLYAHMNNFARGIHSGKRVRQGQVIGYVGSTGLATGPHLHYEFYQNGAVRNPVTVKLPHAEPIAKADKSSFLTIAKQMQGQLSTYAAAMKSENLARLGE